MPGTEERHSFRWQSSAASHSRLPGSASLRSGIDLTRLFDATCAWNRTTIAKSAYDYDCWHFSDLAVELSMSVIEGRTSFLGASKSESDPDPELNSRALLAVVECTHYSHDISPERRAV
jgi:hypothetical protein